MLVSRSWEVWTVDSSTLYFLAWPGQASGRFASMKLFCHELLQRQSACFCAGKRQTADCLGILQASHAAGHEIHPSPDLLCRKLAASALPSSSSQESLHWTHSRHALSSGAIKAAWLLQPSMAFVTSLCTHFVPRCMLDKLKEARLLHAVD